ncbi:hypothetical protein C823_005479 [Eubacterium plexicaudatum ASF492]|nr:hypothetical protein C823_005479 [Eubacterium plexicaudatum ASF492]
MRVIQKVEDIDYMETKQFLKTERINLKKIIRMRLRCIRMIIRS